VLIPPVFIPPVFIPPVFIPPVFIPPVFIPPVFIPPVFTPPALTPPALAPPALVPLVAPAELSVAASLHPKLSTAVSQNVARAGRGRRPFGRFEEGDTTDDDMRGS